MSARKTTIEKEAIINAAVALIRENGHEALNARAVAKYLGCSTQPIFSNFSNMNELKVAALKSSLEIYNAFLHKEMADPSYISPYKAAGMGYIKFAIQEKNLFKFLYMRDRSNEDSHVEDETFASIIPVIMKAMGLTEKQAYDFHLSMWVVVHGIAAMCATSYVQFDMDLIDRILSDAFLGFRNSLHGDTNGTRN